jgi:protoporphyrinogen oxidase
MPRLLIVGAGPTGLGAALHLQERGETDWLVLDEAREAGGLASSFCDDQGFTWDLGGHVQFSHYRVFDDYMDRALGQDGWLHHQRESWIWMRDRFIPYPFQYNLHRLPPAEQWDCVRGLLEVSRATPGPARDFAEWVLATFGKGIAETFLQPYNFKVWAHPLDVMNAHWVGDRVAVPDLAKVLEGICLQKDQVSWGPNSTFRFPKYGGTGSIWRALSAQLGDRVRLGARVQSIDAKRREVTLENGETIGYDTLISSLPLDVLVGLLRRSDLERAAQGLLYSTTHVVGVGLEGVPPEHLRTKCWMYFPEQDCPFYRVTVFSNYSPHNTPRPGETWSLMAEVSQSAFKPVSVDSLAQDVLAGCRATRLIAANDRVLSVWSHSLTRGYPIPSTERDAALDLIQPSLEAEQIYSRGRFGAWKYEVSNQDHSFMQGWECVSRILSGDPSCERTLRDPNGVNAGYNTAAAC